MSPRRRPESVRARLLRVVVPGTTGGLYALACGSLGFLTVLVLFVHAHFTGRQLPDVADSILLASVGMLGTHQWRGSRADRANADNGVVPVPADPGAAAPPLPDLRPRDP